MSLRVYNSQTGTWDLVSGNSISVSGAPGASGYTPIKGVDYFDGTPGASGTPGLSAYEIALTKGASGTEEEWLNSLKATATRNIDMGNPWSINQLYTLD